MTYSTFSCSCAKTRQEVIEGALGFWINGPAEQGGISRRVMKAGGGRVVTQLDPH